MSPAQKGEERMDVMAIEVVEGATSIEEPDAILINLRVEAENGQISKITATDNDGKQWIVSLKLRDDVAGDICCCPSPSGKLICLSDTMCSCDPI
jgi:hypothetical protein